MSIKRYLAATAAILWVATAVHAETLNMGGASAAVDDGRPTRGMTQQGVQAKFGEPQSTRAAVGDPPITRWEYADFVVYFEYDKVIHAVLKR